MSEKLISEKWLRDYLDDYDTKVLEPAALQILNNFHAALIEAPAVDAVDVVRCGDCRHIVQIGNAYYCKVWRGHNGYGIDGFCCYGERDGGKNE